MENNIQIDQSKDVVDKSSNKKVITISSSILKDSVRALSGIARNAMNDEDKLINFMCYGNSLVLTATDTAREAQIELEVNSNVKEVFSTSVNKLMAVLTDGGVTKIEVAEGYLVFNKDKSKIQLPKYKVNHKPFETDFVNDILDIEHFLKVIRVFSKYVTSETDDSGVIIFSGEHVYVRNRLFYAITQFESKEHYIFDKMTCKSIITLCTAVISQDKTIRIAKVEKDTVILLKVGNMSIRVPMLRHDKIDLSKFNKIKNGNGFIVDRLRLLQVIKEIKEVDATSELDIIGINSSVIIRPSSELTLTEYVIPAKEMVIDDKANMNFTYTVNANAFDTLLKGVNTDSTLLSSSSSNMLLLLNKDTNLLIRYFISVF